MTLWLLVPFILIQIALYNLLLINTTQDSTSHESSGFNFIWPQIGPTRFHSQWPFEQLLYSFAWCFQNSFLSLPNGSTTDGNLINFISNTLENSLKINFVNGGGLVKIAPLGTGFLFFIGPSTITIKYTLGFTAGGSSAGSSGSSGSLESSGSFKEVRRQLDPLRPTILSMSDLVSFITIETLNFGVVSFWSDAHSQPTFGSYIIAPYLEFHNSFYLNITLINNTFQIVEHPNSYLVTLPQGPVESLTNFLALLQSSIAEVYPNLLVNFLSLESNVSQLAWTSLQEHVQIKVDDRKSLQSQCATAAMLGLYENGELLALEVYAPPLSQSKSPGSTVAQWPVGHAFQRLANPGSADTDGALRLSFTFDKPLENEIPKQDPDLILPASNFIYKYIGPSANISVDSFLSHGLNQNENVSVSVRIRALSDTTQEILGFTLKNLEIFDHASLSINNSVMIYVSGSGLLNDNLLSYLFAVPQAFESSNLKEDITLKLAFHSDPGQSLGSELGSEISIISNIVCNIVWEPFGFKTSRYSSANAGFFQSAATSASTIYCNLEAWAGGGASLLEGSQQWYGGASSRLQMALMLQNNGLESMEARVGVKGQRSDDLFGQGGQCTYLTVNNSRLFVLGSGGSAALGSHGGQGGGPIGQPYLNDLTTESILRYPGYSGSSAKFTIENNAQVLGPTAKPAPDSQTIETWQGAGGYNHRGINGEFNNGETASRPCAQPGLGSYDLKSFVSGGRGASASNLNGAGGGGPTVIQNVSEVSSDLSIISVTVNGPWTLQTSTTFSGPLGGGFGPYEPNSQTDFQQIFYNCDSTSLLQLISNTLWNRAKQLSWTRSILKHLATELFISGLLAETNKISWTVSDSFVNNLVAYVGLGPCDQFLPDVGGPNVTPMNSGEQILFDENNTICILNQGQITDELQLYLNTSFSGPGVPEGTLVQSIRFGPSKPLGIYSSSIYLSLSETLLDYEGPFTWLLPKSQSFLIGPPTFNNGTLIHSEGIKPFSALSAGYQFDQTLSSISIQELVNAVYKVMTYANFSTSIQLQSVLPSDSESGPSYLQILWPVQQQRLRVFIRPMVLPTIQGPRSTIINLEFGEDAEIPVPEGTQAVRIYAFGAGASSLNIYKGQDGQFACASVKGLVGQTLRCRVGQGGGSGLPQGSHGGINVLNGTVVGGGASFITTTTNNRPLIYAAGGGSGGLNEPQNKFFNAALTSLGSNSLFGNPGGSGFLWGRAGPFNCAGSSGSSYAPQGFVSKNIIVQKYYTSSIGFGSIFNNAAGHGKIILEFIY